MRGGGGWRGHGIKRVGRERTRRGDVFRPCSCVLSLLSPASDECVDGSACCPSLSPFSVRCLQLLPHTHCRAYSLSPSRSFTPCYCHTQLRAPSVVVFFLFCSVPSSRLHCGAAPSPTSLSLFHSSASNGQDGRLIPRSSSSPCGWHTHKITRPAGDVEREKHT